MGPSSSITRSALLLIAVALICAGCGNINGKIGRLVAPSGENDFKKSEIITSGPAIADGRSELLVAIQLTNSNGTPVPSYKPKYEIVSGLGVAASECTTSNINGVATCILRSTQSGTKRLSVTNIKIDLEKDVVFNAPASGNKPVIGLISASQQVTSGQYKLSGTVGSQEPGTVKTNGAFKLYGGIQGEAFSR